MSSEWENRRYFNLKPALRGVINAQWANCIEQKDTRPGGYIQVGIICAVFKFFPCVFEVHMYVFIWYNIQWGFWQQKCTIQNLHTAHLESRTEWRDSALIHGVYVGRPFTIDLLGQTERKKSGEDERYLQPSYCLSRAQGWKPVLWISSWWNIFFPLFLGLLFPYEPYFSSVSRSVGPTLLSEYLFSDFSL